jgi:VWFA-related protein
MKILALALSLLAAQAPYVETFEVRVQNLDVIVTDRKGNPVPGLTKDDFIVLDAGKPQEISNFSAYQESAGSAATTGGTAAAPATVTAEAPPPRKVVFFLDEMALHPTSRDKILRNAMQLVESMGERDEAMVVTATGPENVVLDMTSDRKAIRGALEKTLAMATSRATTQAATEIRYLDTQMRMSSAAAEIRDVRRRYASMIRRRVEQRLGSLRALVASLAGMEGKKVVVLISSSLAAMPGLEEAAREQAAVVESFGRPVVSVGAPGTFINSDAAASTIGSIVYDLRPLIADLGRTAAASGITIYPLQPDVPLDLIAPGSVETRNNSRYRTADSYATVLTNNQMAMVSLAETTGGRWFRGDGRIDDVFRQIGTDVKSYYSIGYHVKEDRDRARRLEVRVKNRPELTVRTRSDVVEKSTAREMTDLTMATLLYTHPVNELGIVVTTAAPKHVRDAFSIPVEVLIPMSRLTFLPAANGRYAAAFRVHYATSGDRTDFVTAEEREQQVEISAAEYKALAGKTFRYTSNVVVTRGRYRIAVGVIDATSRLTGFKTVTVTTN